MKKKRAFASPGFPNHVFSFLSVGLAAAPVADYARKGKATIIDRRRIRETCASPAFLLIAFFLSAI